VKAPVKNVTLSLPEPLLREFRIYAATQDRSMTALMTDAIAKMVGQDAEREKAGRRFLERIRRAPDRGVGGKITWTREELHDR
jgi:hypothetical protein